MSRQLDQLAEERGRKRAKRIAQAVEYALEDAISRAGGELVGLSANIVPGECLLVLKVYLSGRRQVAFVGAEDFGSALMKAVREGNRDKLVWKEDKYAGPN